MKNAKKHLRTLLAVLLTAALLLAMTSAATAAKPKTIASGYCGGEGDGKNLSWKLDSTNTLTISGTGAMQDYELLSDGSPTLFPSAPWLEYKTKVVKVVIKSGVTTIGDYAFDSEDFLESISLPDTLQSIGLSAFWSCERLKALSIPDSVTSIGEVMCGYCEGIKTLKISESLTEIPNDAFYFCSSLKSVVIPEKVTVLGRAAFLYCTSLEYVKLPSHLTEIGDRAFDMCNKLKYINLPDTLVKIGYDALHAEDQTELILPESVTEIGGSALSFPNLQRIKLPSGLTEISYYMLSGLPKMTDLIIPDGVTKFGYRALVGCDSVEELILPEGVTSVDVQAFAGIGIKTVTVPRNLTELSSYAFQGCEALETAKITSDLTVITQGLFNDCYALKTIVLPASLEKVEKHAFLRCNQLSDVYFLGTEEQWNQLEVAEENEPLLNATVHFHTADHSVTETPAVASDCKVKGHTAGLYCNDCGVYLAGNDTAPRPWHAWSDWTVVKEATVNATGTMQRTCAECGETQQETIDRLPKPEDHGGAQSQTFLEKVAQWFRDLFAKFASLFRF